jgi:hypothetical protein
MGNAVAPPVAAALGRCLLMAAEGAAPVGVPVVFTPDPEYEAIVGEARSRGLRFWSEDNDVPDVSGLGLAVCVVVGREGVACNMTLGWSAAAAFLWKHACLLVVPELKTVSSVCHCYDPGHLLVAPELTLAHPCDTLDTGARQQLEPPPA